MTDQRLNAAAIPAVWRETDRPYFCWDRSLTVGDIHALLASADAVERRSTLSWIMREAAFRDVWRFVSPEQVYSQMSSISSLLGRQRDFWLFIMKKWHELGKV